MGAEAVHAACDHQGLLVFLRGGEAPPEYQGGPDLTANYGALGLGPGLRLRPPGAQGQVDDRPARRLPVVVLRAPDGRPGRSASGAEAARPRRASRPQPRRVLSRGAAGCDRGGSQRDPIGVRSAVRSVSRARGDPTRPFIVTGHLYRTEYTGQPYTNPLGSGRLARGTARTALSRWRSSATVDAVAGLAARTPPPRMRVTQFSRAMTPCFAALDPSRPGTSSSWPRRRPGNGRGRLRAHRAGVGAGVIGRLEYLKYCTPVDFLPITGSNPLSGLGPVDRPILARFFGGP